MDQKPRLQKAPKPTDLEGWRQAISRGLLSTFRLGRHRGINSRPRAACRFRRSEPAGQAPFECDDPVAPKTCRSQSPKPGRRHYLPRTRSTFEALLKPSSADGKTLRQNFTTCVSFRVKDAIAMEQKHSRIPVTAKIKKTVRGRKFEETAQIAPGHEPTEPANDTDLGEDASPRISDRRSVSIGRRARSR